MSKEWIAAVMFALVGWGVAGCGSSQESAAPVAEAAGNDDHSGWWCNEHGVPEGICTRCNATLIATFKAKGDWCKEHDLPDSQCFTCHPEKQAEFAAQYEARFGKQPPKPGGDG